MSRDVEPVRRVSEVRKRFRNKGPFPNILALKQGPLLSEDLPVSFLAVRCLWGLKQRCLLQRSAIHKVANIVFSAFRSS